METPQSAPPMMRGSQSWQISPCGSDTLVRQMLAPVARPVFCAMSWIKREIKIKIKRSSKSVRPTRPPERLKSPSAPREESSMSQIEFVVDQLKRAFDGEPWHGPALMEILDGIDAKTAAARPISTAHSIWELALHVAGWEKVAIRRIRGVAATLT